MKLTVNKHETQNIQEHLKKGVKELSLKTLKTYCSELEMNLSGNKQQLYDRISKKIKKNTNITLDVSDLISLQILRYIRNIIPYIEDIGDQDYHHIGSCYINPNNNDEIILDLDTSIWGIPHQIVIIFKENGFKPTKIYPKNQDILYSDTDLLKVLDEEEICVGIEDCDWSPVITPGVVYVYWSNFLYENKYLIQK